MNSITVGAIHPYTIPIPSISIPISFGIISLSIIILAGSALWAKALHDRVSTQMKALESAKGFLAPADAVAEANQQYTLLATSIDEYINKVLLLGYCLSPS